MDGAVAEHFLLDQFSVRYRALIPPLLKDARAAAALLAKAEPILQVESAQWNHGRLVSWAVDLGVERLIQSGRWPVDYRWRCFAQPTGRYLEVRFSHSTLSISQVSDSAVQPRNVVFRHNARLSNQQFLALPEFDDVRSVAGLPSFILVHGRVVRGELENEFAHVGIPHRRHEDGWIYRTPNLMDLPHSVSSDLPPVEDTDADAVMTLKEEIEKWRRDHGHE